MTYIGEFEKVHFPLPLNFVEEPDEDALRRTIDRMKNLILMQKSNAFSIKSAEPLGQYANTTYDDFASIEIEN